MAEEKQFSFGDRLLACMCCCVLLPGAIAGFVTLIVLSATSKDPVYSVTITAVAGLDNPSANLPSSPVFDLTVRIDNSRGHLSGAACIGRLSTVAVLYGDAVLANRGSVPEFCAGEGKVRERGVRAWGKDVDLPQFLRDQLAGEFAAGEAAVDVKVTTPAGSLLGGDKVFVCSQVKIGGGPPATCRKETVYQQQQANPGSTG